jgi:hypothetical protein
MQEFGEYIHQIPAFLGIKLNLTPIFGLNIIA